MGGVIFICLNWFEFDSYGLLSLGVVNNNGMSFDGVWN